MACFDMCQFGLVSPVSKKPLKKRTKYMTNCPEVFDLLDQRFCDGSHEHQTIEGSEGGVKISYHAQHYPEPFVLAVCQGVMQCKQRFG